MFYLQIFLAAHIMAKLVFRVRMFYTSIPGGSRRFRNTDLTDHCLFQRAACITSRSSRAIPATDGTEESSHCNATRDSSAGRRRSSSA